MTRVVCLPVGRARIPGPELHWMSDWGLWHELMFHVVLVRTDSAVVLVNTGPPADLTALNERWVAVLGEGAQLRRDADHDLLGALAREGLAPEDITDVVITPFQAYTTGRLLDFPRATVHLSRRGWVHFHTTHEHPHDDRATSLPRDVLVHLVTDGWDRVHLLADEDEVTPGVRIWFAGGHHRASLCVEVDTREGPVVISDAFFTYSNVEDGRILGINESMAEILACYERVRRTARHIVPLYEPRVLDRYPGGVVVT